MKNPLADMSCQPLEGTMPMPADAIASQLAQLQGWAFVEGAIEKRYEFADFHRTMAFVNALAWIAHAEDHHPDLAVSYGHCTVRFNTHSVGGISINDFICAAKLDALFAAP
jgi:4a-hydroxytetrahydrobiopterin dehydratase